MTNLYYDYFDSPIGTALIECSDKGVRSVKLVDERNHAVHSNEICKEVSSQLEAYFLGVRMNFDLPLEPSGTTFQKEVWRQLMTIPYGETTHYGEIANLIGNPKASRAVGAANGKNPIWIIVPCHRIIGANGKLTGYAGGIDRKKWLLDHEKKHKG